MTVPHLPPHRQRTYKDEVIPILYATLRQMHATLLADPDMTMMDLLHSLFRESPAWERSTLSSSLEGEIAKAIDHEVSSWDATATSAMRESALNLAIRRFYDHEIAQ